MNLFIYLKHFLPQDEHPNEGATKFVHGLASGLTACGTRVTVLCEGVERVSRQTPEGYQIECFANPRSQPSFTLAPALRDYIVNHRQDSLVILNGMFHLSVYALSRLLRQHQIPYIVSPLDPYHPSIFRKNAHLKWPYWYLLERRLLAQATAIQLLDLRHTEWLRRLGVQTPTIATPCGYFSQDVHPESTLQYRASGNPKLFFLGRLDAYNKGLDILLTAFAQIQLVSPAQLVIQGPDWGDLQYLKMQATQLGLSDTVTFLEPDFDASPSALIANYDIFCIPSRFEGFSQSALEAMLSGRVLLISEIAGIAPYVEASQCGIVVKPEATSIEMGFLELLERRSEWQEMGLRGRQYVLENLDWKTIASRALAQYQQIYSGLTPHVYVRGS
jgi:glycosyltransferase involved in cell wall biosynthesis